MTLNGWPRVVFSLVALSVAGGAVLHAQDAAGEEPWEDDAWEETSEPVVAFHGFLEAARGTRLQDDPAIGASATLEELRFRAELSADLGPVRGSFKADLFADQVDDDDSGYKIREALASFSVGDFDFRLGRQVLTWGTGDLVFLNDLFPKDWVSFFAGREPSYLKYPSDALKVGIYKQALNVDLVWTPYFESDNFIDGRRFSYFSPSAGTVVGAPPAIEPVKPSRTIENGEFAVRLHRTIRAWELALYGYRGFFKQPRGFDPVAGRATFPPLSTYGASGRGPAWGGIGYAEVAWYDSRDDRRGNDPLVPNSQYRILLGHERELVANLTLGLQYYVEGIVHATTEPEDVRHVVTTRLTRRARQDRLVLSLFAFASPSAEDWFLLPGIGYRISDRWQWDAGLRLFGGRDEETFLGQFEDNSNLFMRLRFSF